MKESNTSGRDWLLCEDPRNQYGEERNQGIRRDPAAVLQGRSLFWARPTPWPPMPSLHCDVSSKSTSRTPGFAWSATTSPRLFPPSNRAAFSSSSLRGNPNRSRAVSRRSSARRGSHYRRWNLGQSESERRGHRSGPEPFTIDGHVHNSESHRCYNHHGRSGDRGWEKGRCRRDRGEDPAGFAGGGLRRNETNTGAEIIKGKDCPTQHSPMDMF